MNNNNQYDKQINCHKLKRGIKVMVLALLVTFCFNSLTAYAKNPVIIDEKNQENKATNNLVQPDHYQYGIGSVSKMFATVAVMKLVDEGKIDLDIPLTYYIPEFSMSDKRYRQITPKMLLNHSSGLMGTTWHNSLLSGDADTSYHDTFLNQLKNQELKADPGEYSVYCNDGFTLAEILVERVSGMSFSEFIRRAISTPLGLQNTFAPIEGVDESVLAPLYFNNHTVPYINCQPLASGGIYSTPENLCKFSQIFMKDSKANLLSKKSIELMTKPWYLNDKFGVNIGNTQIGYGLGWDCVNTYPYTLYGIKALVKGGDVDGYHANLTVLPEQNLSIAVTSSGGSNTFCQEVAQDIILEVLKEEGIIHELKDIKIKAENKVDAAPLPDETKQYKGYYISENLVKVAFNDEGTLLLKPIDTEYDSVQEFVYTKSGEFVSTKGYYMGNMGQLMSNANGNKGLTKFSFRKESNGKVYIIGSTYESTHGLGEMAYTIPLGEKIEPNLISETVSKKWKDRADKKYYLINEVYNSRTFLEDPFANFKTIAEISGYVTRCKKGISQEKCRIIDENTAKCEIDLPGMIGVNLKNYKFYSKDKGEYVSVSSNDYADEETVKSSDVLTNQNVVIAEDLTAWYAISRKDAGAIIKIEAPNNGAYYVYDKTDNCIASSIFKEESDSIMLPTEGHIVLAGNKDAVFHINKE